ncbi:MAG TPA: protein kinase [Pyrinomonadaceae bacterium]|nr:protein kinase [Pyrinomonadaceae bacterium]
MTPERWQRVTAIFEAALQHDAHARSAYVIEACGDDRELRGEVEAMLASHYQASRFIEEPAVAVAARLVTNTTSDSLIGQTLAHYKVLSLLGRGGMGEVYLAEDTRLGRKVALKLLPDEFAGDAQRLARFRQEARTASALSHPNIVTIHEIGEADSVHFMTTEFVDGQSLRQYVSKKAIELSTALDVATQVASALAAAHDVGVVHRDIKPDNIMIRRDRLVKVLDFGLAKLAEGSDATGAPTNRLVNTEPGVVMGTANYMSPEQARGAEVDGRTDIWSLGVILYEMLTGRVPFEGDTPAEVFSRILQKEPLPVARYAPDAPEELQRIVTKSLSKDRDGRYQTIKDLLIDLQALRRRLDLKAELARTVQPDDGTIITANQQHTTVAETPQGTATTATHAPSSAEYIVGEVKRHKGAFLISVVAIVLAAAGIYLYSTLGSRQIKSLAVLPVANSTGDPNTDYLSEGLTESLIDNLTQLPDLQVKSLNSVMRYKGRETDAQAVGRELGVDAVVTGRMMQRDDGLVVSVEMVDVRDNSRIWGRRYDRKLSDLLAVQNEISREVLNKLRLRLTGEEEKRATKRYSENTEAYQLYLKGRYHWNRRAIDDLWKGIDNFQRAIQLDPNFALAWSGLADSYVAMVLGGPFAPTNRPPMPIAEVRTKWGAAARRAVDLDPELAEVHTSLGQGLEWLEWDLAGAEREYKRALELNPDYATAHQRYGVFLLTSGRKDEGLRELKRALELDPASLPINADLGSFYCGPLGMPDQGIEQLKKTIELAPDWPRAHFLLSNCYAEKGMWNEAIQEIQQVGVPGYVQRARMYAATGRRDEALKVIAEMKERSKQQYVAPITFAFIYVALDEKDLAFEYLEKGLADRTPLMRNLATAKGWDKLRSDPRFTDLLNRSGLNQK